MRFNGYVSIRRIAYPDQPIHKKTPALASVFYVFGLIPVFKEREVRLLIFETKFFYKYRQTECHVQRRTEVFDQNLKSILCRGEITAFPL